MMSRAVIRIRETARVRLNVPRVVSQYGSGWMVQCGRCCLLVRAVADVSHI